MYPHSDGIRRRRGGQIQRQIPPQHLIGIPQQSQSVMLPVGSQPVQILQNQHHFSNPAQFQVPRAPSKPYPPPAHSLPGHFRQPPQSRHAYDDRSDVLTEQASNHNKKYTEDYTVSEVNHTDEEQSEEKENMAHPTTTDSEKNEESTESATKDHVHETVSVGVKEKTPMCLVNELARFNKITHQYRLTNEQGPAHKKSFTVTLTLGEEEYTADGPSIKKAQHAAAADALTKTTYSRPAPKNNRFLPMGNMTPTVELNALAMKRGEPAIYKLVEYPGGQGYGSHSVFGYRRTFGPRGAYFARGGSGRGGRYPGRPNYGPVLTNSFVVVLKVGEREYTGKGSTPQMARHDAASKALCHLRKLPDVPHETVREENNLDQDIDSSIKSPISLVHEVAQKRDLNVAFNVVSETGPPHMKIFLTECIVGELRTEGEGNGKKISKKRAAENMLVELKKLPPLSNSPTPPAVAFMRLRRKLPGGKKKTRNLIKFTEETKPEAEKPEEINPISRLIQMQQVKKEREPVYTLLEEKGYHRKREFVMEVAIGELKATGLGHNKKTAKKNAAQNLLLLIEGKGPDAALPIKEDKKPNAPSGSGGRQLAPGLLLVNENHQLPSTKGEHPEPEKTSPVNTEPPAVPKTYPKGFGPKEQLLYLSKVMNFEVNFSDYPKASHREHLTLVSMSTDPPQVCHGSASTIEEAHNEAAATALRALAAMGLDCQPSAENTPKQ